MALSIVNTTSAVENTGTTALVINVPSGVANGDLLVLTYIANTGSTTPSGWTAWLTTTNNRSIWYKNASSEPASYSLTNSANEPSSACIVALRDAAIDVMGTVSASANPSVAASITTTANGAFVFSYVGVNSANRTFTTPAGYTLLASDSDATSPSYALFYTTQTTAGATGTLSVSANGAARGTLFSIILGVGAVTTGNFFFMMGT
jgi:hypothetical protein